MAAHKLLLLFLVLLLFHSSARAQSTPVALVASTVTRVMSIIQIQPADQGEREAQRREIRKAAQGLFDFQEMSRRILGQRWDDATPEQQEQFVDQFTGLIERVYLSTLGNYRLATITYRGETIVAQYAQVRSTIVTEKGEVVIEYRLFQRDSVWRGYDVAVEGVSLISNYRSQFNTLLKRMTFLQLLQHLRDKELSFEANK